MSWQGKYTLNSAQVNSYVRGINVACQPSQGGLGGGGSFSGKDPAKVDRSAAYVACYIAKNIVAAGLAERIETQISYSIGVAHPLSVSPEISGTAKVDHKVILDLIDRHFDLRPEALIRSLNLRRPATSTAA